MREKSPYYAKLTDSKFVTACPNSFENVDKGTSFMVWDLKGCDASLTLDVDTMNLKVFTVVLHDDNGDDFMWDKRGTNSWKIQYKMDYEDSINRNIINRVAKYMAHLGNDSFKKSDLIE